MIKEKGLTILLLAQLLTAYNLEEVATFQEGACYFNSILQGCGVKVDDWNVVQHLITMGYVREDGMVLKAGAIVEWATGEKCTVKKLGYRDERAFMSILELRSTRGESHFLLYLYTDSNDYRHFWDSLGRYTTSIDYKKDGWREVGWRCFYR